MASSRSPSPSPPHTPAGGGGGGILLSDGTFFPSAAKERSVGVSMLVWLVFFSVSGGCYGVEEAVRAGGPAPTMIVLLLVPLAFSLPVALLTAELAAAMPESGGYVIWVARAFGKPWGVAEGYLSWVAAIFDNALYPVLFAAYCGQIADLSQTSVYALRVSLVLFCTLTNLLGVQLVGVLSLVFGALTLAPFVIMSAWELPHINFDAALSGEALGNISFGLLLSSVIWNNSGWDSVGNFAGNVKDPQTTYVKASTIVVLVVTVVNTLPVLVAISVDTDYTSWNTEDGFWARLGDQIGGEWMRVFVVTSALVSNLGLLNVLLASSSWALYAVCVPGLLDFPCIAQVSREREVPYVAVLVSSSLVLACCFSSFDVLVQVDMSLGALSLLLEIAALLWLRIREPDMSRPFRIPLETKGLIAFMVPPTAICVAIVATATLRSQLYTLAAIGAGAIIYMLARWRSERARAKLAESVAAGIEVEDSGDEDERRRHLLSSPPLSVKSEDVDIIIPESRVRYSRHMGHAEDVEELLISMSGSLPDFFVGPSHGLLDEYLAEIVEHEDHEDESAADRADYASADGMHSSEEDEPSSESD